MRSRRLWPLVRSTSDPALQFAWGLLQGTVLGITVLGVLLLGRALT